VRGIRCAVRGTRCAVRGIRCAVRGIRCAVRGICCAVRGTHCAVRGTHCAVNPILRVEPDPKLAFQSSGLRINVTPSPSDFTLLDHDCKQAHELFREKRWLNE